MWAVSHGGWLYHVTLLAARRASNYHWSGLVRISLSRRRAFLSLALSLQHHHDQLCNTFFNLQPLFTKKISVEIIYHH